MSNLSRQFSPEELSKLADQLPIQYSFNASIKGTDDKEKKSCISCRLITEVGNYSTSYALAFRFQVSNYVKADTRHKNADGKYIKGLIELWEDAKVFYFDKEFKLSVVNSTENIFPNVQGRLDDLKVSTRVQLAEVLLALLQYGSIQLADYRSINGDRRLIHAYDTTVLILLELIKLSKLDDSTKCKFTDRSMSFEKADYLPIEQIEVLKAITRASSRLASEYNLPLIVGTPLHNMTVAANHVLQQQAQQSTTTLPVTINPVDPAVQKLIDDIHIMNSALPDDQRYSVLPTVNDYQSDILKFYDDLKSKLEVLKAVQQVQQQQANGSAPKTGKK